MVMHDESFVPLDYGFAWSDDWYDYDSKAAESAAKKARREYAADQRKLGRTVKLSTSRNNLMSRGGIGSGNPHIELIVPVYHALVIG